MKFIKRLLLFFLLAAFVGIAVSLVRMVQSDPLVPVVNDLTTSDLSQARAFIENVDPRELEPGSVNAFTVNEQDLELLIGYGLSRLDGGGARVDLRDGLANLTLTARLPENFLGEYLNVQVTMSQWGKALAIEDLQIGGVRIPGAFADPVLQYTHEQLQQVPEYVAALQAINGYTIARNQVHVVYQWQPELVEQISNRGRDLLISAEDQERLLAHASNLAAITTGPQLGNQASVADILSPMFLFAKARGGDPVEENRAAILAVTMYVMGISMPRVLGLPENSVPPMEKHRLLLSGRHDFAQHFLISAGLTASTGTGVADAIGLLKELDDSEGGSGFSFTDLGADRAGVRFAELAIGTNDNARRVQDRFSYGLAEAEFMPEFRDLPEFMEGETFQRIYGGVGTERYNAVTEDIENRISSAPLFSQLAR